MTYLLAHLRQIDGQQIRQTGKSVNGLTMREMCNVAYSHYVDDMTGTFRAQVARGATWETNDPLGEQIEAWEEKIGLRYDPAIVAQEMLRAWQESQGMTWDDTPVAADDKWLAGDVNIEFSSMDDLTYRAGQ